MRRGGFFLEGTLASSSFSRSVLNFEFYTVFGGASPLRKQPNGGHSTMAAELRAHRRLIGRDLDRAGPLSRRAHV